MDNDFVYSLKLERLVLTRCADDVQSIYGEQQSIVNAAEEEKVQIIMLKCIFFIHFYLF